MGPVAKFLRARFVGKLRSAEPLPTQSGIEIRSSETAVHNQKLDRAAFPCSSHTGREKFADRPKVVTSVCGDAAPTNLSRGAPSRGV